MLNDKSIAEKTIVCAIFFMATISSFSLIVILIISSNEVPIEFRDIVKTILASLPAGLVVVVALLSQHKFGRKEKQKDD